MSATYNMRPLWDAILEIYKAVAAICERHNLRFYVIGGNCLGAVRHGGFIPWDDDMDVFLPWEDYDKFWKYAEKELPPHFKAVTWWNTPEFGEVFGKIMESRKDVVDGVVKASGLPLSQGIFVDVFPIVYRPTTLREKVEWAVTGFFLRLKWSFVINRGHRPTLPSKVAGIIGWLFLWAYPSLRDNQSAMAIHDRRARKHGKRADGYCGWYFVNICDVDSPIPGRFFNEVVYVQYDSVKVPVPRDYREYLEFCYGDYMKLPPEHERVPSHSETRNVAWRLGPTGVDMRHGGPCA